MTMNDLMVGTPTATPPGAGADVGVVGVSEPTIADAVVAGTAESAPTGPTAMPPASVAAAADGGITGAWHTGMTVDALWSIDETRNAWMRVVGVGWKKLYNGRDGAFTALAILASQARQTGRQINYRDEADGMVYEIYLW